jgi:hypothetical protein
LIDAVDLLLRPAVGCVKIIVHKGLRTTNHDNGRVAGWAIPLQ